MTPPLSPASFDPALSLPPICHNLAEIAPDYTHFIIDIWGVLNSGHALYDGALEAMTYLKAQGKQTLLLTNAPSRAAKIIEKELNPIGLTPDYYTHILTSGEAARRYLITNTMGKRAFVFWQDDTASALEGLGYDIVYDIREADFIFGTLLPSTATVLDYADILAYALEHGLPFVCANPDRVVAINGHLHLCVGTLAEKYERAGGKVSWFGKPFRHVYDIAWDMLGHPDKRKILAVGDSLVTDVTGAKKFGCDVLWNATGIHWEELKSDHQEDKIDPRRISKALEDHPTPTYLINGFKV